jgi:REP element-mobilizing transposase RayT
MSEREFYHVCSEGLERRMIFRNREEFVFGMNQVAILCQKYMVTVLCFCLMGNHFHFILSGPFQECLRFGNEYKRMCAMLMRRNQGIEQAMKDVEVQIKRIADRSYLEYAIAYVLRNPMVAGFRLMPHQYPWGSGDMYFRNDYVPAGRKVDSFREKELRKMGIYNIKSIPESYLIDSNGMISPLCYVDYKTVEDLFGHPARLTGLLSARKEAEFEVFLGIADKYNPDMEELKDSVRELIQIEFGVKAVSQLSLEQKMRLCGMMRRNFHASKKQIALITRLNLETISRLV